MSLFSKRPKAREKKRSKVTKLLVIPCAVLLGVIVSFFMFDEFWLYAQLMLFTNNPAARAITDRLQGTSDSTILDGTGNASGGVGFQGEGGLNLALINSMSSGYLKDYLEIMRDHCNWIYMSSEVPRIQKDGADVSIPINAMIGSFVTETGVDRLTAEDGSYIEIPKTQIDPEDYEAVPGLNLYTVNSAWFNANGLDWVQDNCSIPSEMQWGDPSTDGGGLAHTTPCQFDLSWFSVYPAGGIKDCTTTYGRYVSSGKTIAEYSSRYPSTLNTGYGLDSGTTRTNKDIDAAYFPDILSAVIQSSHGRLYNMLGSYGYQLDYTILDNPELIYGAMHIPHHGDADVFDLAAGCNGSKFETTSGTDSSIGTAAAGALNVYTALLQKVYDYFQAHVDDGTLPDSNYFLKGRSVDAYSGIGVALILLEGDGFFRSSGDRQAVLNKLDNNAQFQAGMKLGFEIAGKSSDVQDIKSTIMSSTRLKTNLGSNYPTKLPHDASSYTYIYTFDPEITGSYNGGANTSALHAWGVHTLGWIFNDPVYGSYLYWQMLKVSGVDCKYSEVLGSVTGAGTGDSGGLIGEIPSYTTTASNIGEVIAECAVLNSWEDGNYDGKQWKSADIAYATWGNAMYIASHRKCNATNIQYRCCDAFVNTAVLWSGADSTCTKQSVTRGCYPYLSKSEKWEEVASWKGGTSKVDLSVLQPGDIIVYMGGHIMVYVGDIVAKVYPQYADSVTSHNLAHASYAGSSEKCVSGENYARSGKLSSLEGYIKYCRSKYTIYAFRCVKPDSTAGQTAFTDAELAYLKANPWQSKTQYHSSYSSAGTSSVSNVTIRLS